MTTYRVHEEIDHRLVPCSHGKNIYYRISFGTVLWDQSDQVKKRAFFILMQYGSTDDWIQAKSNREIAFRKSPHILTEDMDNVLQALSDLKKK